MIYTMCVQHAGHRCGSLLNDCPHMIDGNLSSPWQLVPGFPKFYACQTCMKFQTKQIGYLIDADATLHPPKKPKSKRTSLAILHLFCPMVFLHRPKLRHYYHYYFFIIIILRVSHTNVSWGLISGVYVIASLLKFPGLFTVFWSILIKQQSGWSPFILLFPSLPVP